MKSFINTAGTTSTEFGLGVGTGSEVRQFLLTAVANSNVSTFIEGNGFDWALWDNNTIRFRSPTTDFLNAINELGTGGTVTNLTNYGMALEYTSFTIVSSSVSNDGYADYLDLVVTNSVTAQQYIHTLDVPAQAGGTNNALDRNGESIMVSGIEFYDAKVIAKNSAGEVVAKQLRGTVNGTTVTRIEDVFQEDFAADVELTSDGTQLSVNCTGSGNFTVYITMTKVAE